MRALLWLFLLASAAVAQPAPLTPKEIRQRLDQAWRQADDRAVYTTLQTAWTDAPSTARDICGQLLVGDSAAQPVGAALLCEYGSAEDVAQAANALSPSGFPDARRMLVRALGKKDPVSARKLAEGFLDDRDPMVRAAAIAACADLGDVDSLGHYIRRIQRPPAYMSSWDGGEDGILDMTMHSAVRTLTGLRPTTAGEVSDWWRGDRVVIEQKKSDPREEILSGVTRGERYYMTPNFDVYLHVKDVEQPMLKAPPEPDGLPNPLQWSVLTQTLEAASAAACKAAEPVFGRVRLPVLRVELCDDRQFAPHAGLSYMGGVSKGNEVVLRLQWAKAIRATMTHEMIHVIQGANYEEEPRWLSEGLAESLTHSPAASMWNKGRVERARLDGWVERGAVSEAIGWTSGASSGDRESRRYALSHLVVDYLRYGGFTAPGARLNYLLGALDRSVPPAQALEAIYGLKPREMDDRLRRWLPPEK